MDSNAFYPSFAPLLAGLMSLREVFIFKFCFAFRGGIYGSTWITSFKSYNFLKSSINWFDILSREGSSRDEELSEMAVFYTHLKKKGDLTFNHLSFLEEIKDLLLLSGDVSHDDFVFQ